VAPLHDVLATTRTLLDHLLAGGAADTTTLDAFGARLRDPLQACITAASRLQLELLHRRVGSLVRDLDPWERRALQVVVLGDHQARRRSLPMQYFEKLLAEPSGTEVRLAYGEGISTVEEAIALVGAKRLDVVIAGLVFGDPLRLYRDVLGDAAADALQSLDISPLT
jgi:hypothetical protein